MFLKGVCTSVPQQFMIYIHKIYFSFSQLKRSVLLFAHQVVQAPLSEPHMLSWVSLFSPNPGTAVKDMDVVGDHCVLVARTRASELVLIVVPLTHPKEAYTLQVSVSENSV